MIQDNQLDLCFATIVELSARLAQRELSPVEVTEAVLDRIERHNDEMRVYISVLRDTALEQARKAEREITDGKYRGPLHGIPVALKDNVATKDIRTSCASMANPDWMPDADATVYTKLRRCGAILVGKANLSEYAFSWSPHFPPPLNPWHAERSSSGSSSGSAVSVATGMAHGSIGTDTGGSGRGPADVNGVVGFKATYGRVSRAGVVPLSYSLDHVSVFARQVADAAIMMEGISGHDPRDEYSSVEPVPEMLSKIGDGIQGIRIARARGYTYEDIDADVVSVVARAFEVLQDLGAEIEDIQLPYLDHCFTLQSSIMLPEAATVHYRTLREKSEKLGEAALASLDLGNVIPATAYIQAQQIRKLIRDRFREIFRRYDVIVGPAHPLRAPDAVTWTTKWTTELEGKVVDRRQLLAEYTGIYNLAGNPAIVIPAGFSSEGTPIGLQIAGRWFDETTVLQVANAFEHATNWHRLRPPLPKTETA